MNRNFPVYVLILFFILSSVLGLMLIVKNPDGVKKTNSVRNLFSAKTIQYPKNTIVYLNIFSEIGYDQSSDYFGFRKSGALYWISALQSIEDNTNVKAVILRVNSPGGTVGATQEVYNEIKRLREKGKIVTVSVGDLAASGAYYLSCAADYIVCNSGSLVGSIGVIMSGMDLSDLFKKIGISYNVIKSGINKDIMSNYRKMTPEERDLLQAVIMDTYSQFFKAVQEGRKIDADKLKLLADGRIFSGNQALSNHLVDEIGDFEQTISITAKMADIKDVPNLVELRIENDSFLSYLSSAFSGISQQMKNPAIAGVNLNTPQEYASPIKYIYQF